jgi:formylglycine-generating enzyme required for sulfatase activity
MLQQAPFEQPVLLPSPTPTPTLAISVQQGAIPQVALPAQSQTLQSDPATQGATAAGTTRTHPTDCMVYAYVPTGEFQMGPDDRMQNVGPADTITVSDFWIAQTEVTNAQYARCVEANGCKRPAGDRFDDPNYANHPVAHVTWLQANDYARWVGGRLPTEAEWERAACGDGTGTHPWGDEEANGTLLNFDGTGIFDTVEVGSYPAGASPYGVLDMAGNVQEWTSSLDEPYPYQADDGREELDASGNRIIRGGSFYYDGYNAMCQTRVSNDPNFQDTDLGFRVVIDNAALLVGDSTQEITMCAIINDTIQ